MLLNEIGMSLTGPNAIAAADAFLQKADLMGYNLQMIMDDIENSKALMFNSMMEIKEKYQDSAVKSELVDEIFSLVETYFNLIALQVGNRDRAHVGVEFIHPNAKLPTYAHEGDQGADVYAVEDIIVEPHTYGNMISTGLKLLIPFGWAVAIRPRSGMSKNTTLRISNSPATIDQQYRGEVKILFDNIGDAPVEIKAGERIAQFVLEKNYTANWTQVDTVEPSTDRGDGGFGSTGK